MEVEGSIGAEILTDAISQFIVLGACRRHSSSPEPSASAPAPVALDDEEGATRHRTHGAATVRAISRECDSLISEWNCEQSVGKKFSTEVGALLDSLLSARSQLEEGRLVDTWTELDVLEANVSVIKLASALQELAARGCEHHGILVPGLVSAVLAALPSPRAPRASSANEGAAPDGGGPYQHSISLPKNARICEYAKGVSLSLQSTLFGDFNHQFDAILNVSGSGSKDIWENFLVEAKPKIVSYVVVSLLPCVIGSATAEELSTAFEAALDAMLGPLWARVYFHLSSARKEGTFSQFVWSIDYCKSVTDVLVILALRVSRDTAVQQMQSRCSVFNDGRSYVLKKAVKFVRAHIAEFLFILSPISSDQLLNMIECTLSFDAHVRQQAHEVGSIELAAVAVLCDVKGTLDVWLNNDATFVRKALSTSFEVPHDSMYSMKFSSLISMDHRNILDGRAQLDIIFSYFRLDKKYACFRCVFDCLWVLTHICSNRYASVPPEYAHFFMSRIIHPVLLLALGALLKFVRADPPLVALATADSLGTKCLVRKEEVFLRFELLLKSVNYFCESLAFLSQSLFTSSACADVASFEQQWGPWRKKLSYSSSLSPQDAGKSKSHDMLRWAFPPTQSSSDQTSPQAHFPNQGQHLDESRGTCGLMQYCSQQAVLICQAVRSQYGNASW